MDVADRTIALCGASGFIGTHLGSHLRNKGYTVVPIRRELLQEGAEKQLVSTLATCGAVINLAGETINHRWTESYKGRLYDSRIIVIRRLVRAMKSCPGIRTFISASAVGYYSSEGCHDENSTDSGNDFLARLCRDWESEARTAPESIRTLVTRFGVVLAPQGGAFGPMARPAKMGVATIIGNGRQPFTWIDIEDLCRGILFLMDSDLDGIFNLTAPQQLSQKEATALIATHYRSKLSVHIPSAAFKALWGEAADFLLKGQCVKPMRLQGNGFRFETPTLQDFLQRIGR